MRDFSHMPSPEGPPADLRADLQADLQADLRAEIEQLQEALASRTVTGQATGILAARFRLHTDQGWALLRETSNLSNRRLSDIARIVVDTHNDVPITGEADQQVVIALVQVLDVAVARINAKAACAAQRIAASTLTRTG